MDAMSNMDNETFCRVPKLKKCKKERREFVERMEAKMKAEDLMVYAITDRYWLNGAKLYRSGGRCIEKWSNFFAVTREIIHT